VGGRVVRGAPSGAREARAEGPTLTTRPPTRQSRIVVAVKPWGECRAFSLWAEASAVGWARRLSALEAVGGPVGVIRPVPCLAVGLRHGGCQGRAVTSVVAHGLVVLCGGFVENHRTRWPSGGKDREERGRFLDERTVDGPAVFLGNRRMPGGRYPRAIAASRVSEH
jgi:hypothetical protein